MSTKFTPGPWEIRGTAVCPEIHSAREVIAYVELNISDDDSTEYRARCKANAQLIASAPDLLDALIEAQETLLHNGIDTGSLPGISQRIRFAIAKATAHEN